MTANNKQVNRRETMRAFFDVMRWSLRLGWSTRSGLLVTLVALTLLRGVLPVAIALAGRNLLNAVAAELEQSTGNFQSIYLWLASGLILALAMALSANIQKYVRSRFQDEINVRLSHELLAHAATLEFANFEDPEFQDLFNQARQNPGDHGAYFITLLLAIAMGLIQVTTLLFVLIYIEPFVIPLLLLVTIPYFLFRVRFARLRYEDDRARAAKRRWSGYYSAHMISAGLVGETKMLNLAPLFLQQFQDIQKEFRERNRRFYRFDLIGTSLFAIVSIFIVYWAFTRATLGVIDRGLTIGDIAIFGAAATQLRSIIEGTVDGMGAVRQQLLLTSVVIDFLAIAPRKLPSAESLPGRVAGGVSLENVTFSYPGTTRPALDNVSMELLPGETVALVGRNGSGKTTLAKLIARLYDPDSGRVLIDGNDICTISQASLHEQIAYVFQNFGQFEASVNDNIAYGKWEDLLDDRDSVREVARYSGVDALIESMPRGYDTHLGRMFGETTLSGGQWQRIAITRALARGAAIIILDEPTANLDMHAEFKLFEHFKQLAEGQTTLLISHRFSTVRMADRVVVLDEGRVVEQGTHDELIARGGEYATLFKLYNQQMLHGEVTS